MLGGSVIWAAAKGFIGSPMGRAVLLLVAFLAWTGYQRHDAAQEAVAELRAEINAETAAEHERQLQAVRESAEAARVRATASERRVDAMEAERDEIIQDLRENPDGDCPIPDDVRQRLLRIGS